MEIQFEAEHIDALNTMENTKKCAYVTGKGGSGKSTMINYFMSKTRKKFVLLGTTGVSAVNIGGQTIHKFFGIIPNKKGTYISTESIELIRKLDMIIIDEAGMIRADLFDRINKILQRVCQNEEFMGGKQIILVGDLFQLPPVPDKNEELRKYYEEKYEGLFFFNGKTFDISKFKLIEFKKVFRQDDPKFINMLNRLRIGDKSHDLINYFNDRYIEDEKLLNPKSILIATTNAIVNEKNSEELAKLPGEMGTSVAYIDRIYPKDSYPADECLQVKVGARVMFTTNDKFGTYVNGTLGTVLKFHNNEKGYMTGIKIETDDGRILSIDKKTWKNVVGEDDLGEDIVDGTFTQFPLKLAFAITIHKVQGKSFDNIVIDLGKRGAFADGQLYVAISRARSYNGIQLVTKISSRDIKSSTEVKNFMKLTK